MVELELGDPEEIFERVIRLDRYRFANGIHSNEMEQAEEALKDYQAVYDAVVYGTAFVRYIDGDRKGSIARMIFDPAYKRFDRPEIKQHWSNWDRFSPNKITHKIENSFFAYLAIWDGRRNKVKMSNSDGETEFLIDYGGPTVWKKFDAKAAKNEILKNPDQRDINDNVLSVGDRVLYINARYGSRMTLDEGTVLEFLASVDSKGHSITTVIESKTGEQSSLSYPESMVYRLN